VRRAETQIACGLFRHHKVLDGGPLVPLLSFIPEDGAMREAETYLEFAKDCRRLAATASDKDKVVLLKIAEAWEAQAEAAAAEATNRKDGDGSKGGVDRKA
jgi:hypothetical protein